MALACIYGNKECDACEQCWPTEDEPQEPTRCPICGSIDCIDEICPHCKSQVYKD